MGILSGLIAEAMELIQGKLKRKMLRAGRRGLLGQAVKPVSNYVRLLMRKKR